VQLETAAKLDPKDPEPYLIEAETYERQQAIALASSEYDRALAIDPKNQRAELGKARILAQGHDIKGAMAIYNQILTQLTTDTDRVSIMDEMAHAYAVEKMNAEADNEYRLAIQTYPKEALAHLNYGDYLAYTKDLAGAEREWLAAAGPDNNYADAVARLGDYYGQQKNYAKATTYFTRLTQLSADDPKVWLALANLYVQTRQFDKAAAAFKQSYAVARSAEALLGLAQADYLSHNYKECSVIYEAVDKNQPSFTKSNPNMLYVLGDCYEGSNQLAKSLATFKRFEPLTPASSNARKEVDKKIAEVQAKLKPPAKKSTASANSKGSSQH
jgi:tetratricopeptide (TPR) repeat protein